MIEAHFCLEGHGVMAPVWKDGTNEAPLMSWICESCGWWEALRPGEETITRGEYESNNK